MSKLRLLSAVSAVAMSVAFAAPAVAFDEVNWSWNHNAYTDLDAFFDINVDFDPWGLTQTERLQVMAGSMTAFADGSYATYTVPGANGAPAAPPVYIYNILAPDQSVSQSGSQSAANTASQKILAIPVTILSKNVENEAEINQKINQDINQVAANVATQNNTVNIYLDQPYSYVPALDALYDLAKVEISATAISNIASIESEHMAMVHDGQIAFGKYNPVQGGEYHPTQDQAAMAGIALSNWIGWDENNYYSSEDDTYGTSGNRMFDMEMLAWTSAQYGLIGKGYNTAVALGDYITNAQVDVSATAAANIHTVAVEPLNAPEAEYASYYGHWYPTGNITTENVAIVDLNQFGYQDTTAYASATYHKVSGFKNLGKLEAPVLKVSASALGNVSTVTNKFGGSAD